MVGTVARMTPQKDPRDLAGRRLRLAAPVRTCASCGSGAASRSSTCASEPASWASEGRLDFAGYREDARQLLGAFDVFLLTSRFEGLPYTPHRGPGLRDAGGGDRRGRDAGRGAPRRDRPAGPAGDVDALAGRVARLLDDGRLAGAPGRGRQADVPKRFSVQAMVTRTSASTDRCSPGPPDPRPTPMQRPINRAYFLTTLVVTVRTSC